jgi:PEP-CTERM motif-containing protein
MKTPKLRSLALVACLLVFTAGASFADSVIGYFNLDAWGYSIPPVGQVIFTLNSNGTVAATLTSYGPATIQGFGFDSTGVLPEYGFSSTRPTYLNMDWWDMLGHQESGFGYFWLDPGPLTESWTIGNPGEFTSVTQLLTGGSSSVDFFFDDSDFHYWGGNAQPYSPTPEPGSLVMLGSAVLGLAGIIRKKLSPYSFM